MGEVRIKSGNLANGELEQGGISVSGDIVTSSARVYGYAYVKSQTAYTIASNKAFRLCYGYNDDGTSINRVGRIFDNNSGNNKLSTFTTPEGCNYIRFAMWNGDASNIIPTDVQNLILVEGTYTSETIPEYQPYFLNRPAHKFINGEWIDIPTHHFINNRWQGELTSQSPLKFRADGEMLDWRVEGKTSGNLFDIGITINDYERAYTIISVDDSSISMKYEVSGMTYHYRTHNITTTGTVTIYCKGSKTKPQLLVRLRSMDDTKWLTNSDVTISGMAYNNVYKGWYSYAESDTFIKTIIIPECLYWNMGVGFNSGGTEGEAVTISNPMVISGTYTASTIPPYEPYGGVGVRTENLFDKDATEDAYIDAKGNIHSSTKSKTSNYIPVLENTSYTLYMNGDISSTNPTSIVFFDLNKDLLSYTTYVPEQGSQSIPINTPASASYVRFSVNNLRENVMFTLGSTAPSTYIPYGYKIPVKIEGENLFDGELEQGSLGTSAGQEYPTTTRVRIKKPGIDLQPGTYTIDCVGATGGVVVYVYNKDSSWDKEQSSKNWQSLPLTFSLSSERLVRFAFRKTGDSDILPSEITDIQLLEGTYTSLTIPPYEVNLYTDHQLMDGDSIDYTTDQTAIPIATGNNVLTVDTAVQPSKVFIKFEG